MYCLECYSENPDGALFCEQCGCPFGIKEKKEETNLLKDRYKIISSLSSGGIGGISLGYDVRLNRACAIKGIYRKGLKDLPQDKKEEILRPFKKEAELLANLRHPNLPCVTDYFVENDICYLVMDYIEGKDLEIILDEQGGEKGLPEKQVMEWAIQICRILEYLHEQKPPVIHGDIKPANLIIRDSDGWIMLVDFGTASFEPNDEEDDYGTDGYAPPEQYIGAREIRSDVYSIGATIYELLAGMLPEEPFKFMPLTKIEPHISSDTERIVMKCLEYEVDNRYTNSTILKQSLLNAYKKNFGLTDSRYRTGKLIVKDQKICDVNQKSELIKVFIIDSDRDMCNNFKDVAAFFKGVLVTGVAYNGKNALSTIMSASEKPDVILMELKISDMKALELINGIKEISPASKIVILTTSLAEEEFLSSFNAGASGYILKGDTSWEDLEKSIKKAYDGGTPISADASTFLIKALTSKHMSSDKTEGLKSDKLSLLPVEKEEITDEDELQEGDDYEEEVIEEILLFEGDERGSSEDEIIEEILLVEDEQIEDANEAIKEDEERYVNSKAEELKEIGRKYILKGDRASALIYFKEALKYNPSDTVINYELGNIYYGSGDLHNALNYYKITLQARPDIADIYLCIGQIYLLEGEYDEAIAYFNKAIEINPEYIDAYLKSGYIKYKQGDMDGALQHFSYVLELDMDNLDAYVGMGNIYQSGKMFENAIKYYNLALSIDENCAEAYSNLGRIYTKNGEFQKALRNIRKAIMLEPAFIRLYDELLERIGEVKEEWKEPYEKDKLRDLLIARVDKVNFPVLSNIINTRKEKDNELIKLERETEKEHLSICSNCNILNRTKSRFCRSCGAEFMTKEELTQDIINEIVQLFLQEEEENLLSTKPFKITELINAAEAMTNNISIIKKLPGKEDDGDEIFNLCPNCETLNRLDIAFCQKCGVEFDLEEEVEEFFEEDISESEMEYEEIKTSGEISQDKSDIIKQTFKKEEDRKNKKKKKKKKKKR
jgi:serine/threonine protein kinase/Tfp pilus assembly protein PilF